MSSPIAQNFVLNDFASEITLSKAVIDSSFTPGSALNADAVAVLTVDLATMKNAFKYQSDAVDVVNQTISDIRYLVYNDLSGNAALSNAANAMFAHSLSPSNGSAVPTKDSQNVDYADDKMMVAHDFVRHLAKELFGTHYGVDLFSNEKELLQNIRSQCSDSSSGVMGVIMQKLKDISVVSAATSPTLYTLLDSNSTPVYKYKTDEDTSDANIGRIFFRQLLNADPERIFTSFAAEATDQPQSIPFIDGDSFSFKLTVNPHADQRLIVTPAKASIAPKSYEIKVYIKSSTSNTPVAAEEL